MKFSVTIPAYKSLFLREAIESVVSQTYSDWELIIVDDCSPEDLKSIVTPFLTDQRIRYYRNEKNCGAVNVVNNWNICLSYCTGDYIICMGDDDRLLPCCLEEYKKLMEKYPKLNVYHVRTEIIDERGHVTKVLEERSETEDALTLMTKRWRGRSQYIGDFCFSRDHLDICGGYYPVPYAWGSDDITVFRAACLGGIANANRTGFQYRENAQSISLTENGAEKIDAVLIQREWHEKKLEELHEHGIYPTEAIQEARQSLKRFATGQIAQKMKNDLRLGGLPRYWHWWRHYPREVFSRLTLVKIFIISITETP